MWGKSIRKFIDELDINSWVYFVILLILGITIFATVYVNHKIKIEKETGFTIEKSDSIKDTAIIIH